MLLGLSTLDASLLWVIFVPDSTGKACELAIASSQITYDFIRESTMYVCLQRVLGLHDSDVDTDAAPRPRTAVTVAGHRGGVKSSEH